MEHADPQQRRPLRHHPVAVVGWVALAAALLYVAAIVCFFGVIATAGCFMFCSEPSPNPILGSGIIGLAAGLAVLACGLLVRMVSPDALRRVGPRGWIDVTTVVWSAGLAWTLWALGWGHLPRAEQGLWAAIIAIGAWRLVPAVRALRSGRDSSDDTPLPHHLPTWARRTLRVLAVVGGLVLLWNVWTSHLSERLWPIDDPLSNRVLGFLAAGLVLPAVTWTATSPRIDRWVLASSAAAACGALPAAIVLLVR